MHQVLKDLIDLLALERIDRDLFRGASQDLGWHSILRRSGIRPGASSSAATPDGRRRTSGSFGLLHGYFLRAGDLGRPIVYQVDRLRDGKSFTTRQVVAVQEGRAHLLSLAASFQVEESGLEHQDPVPEVPTPESLIFDAGELVRALAGQAARGQFCKARDPPSAP